MRDSMYIFPTTGKSLMTSFKTVNGMDACATVCLIDGVATPRNSSFWKVIWKSPLFDCAILKTYQLSFIKILSLLSWRAPFVLENVLLKRRHCVPSKTFFILWNEDFISHGAAKSNIRKKFFCR